MSDLKAEFQQRFGKKPAHIFFSPGRVNLIGEHIDYNGGRVMPCAISLGTYLAVSKNTDKALRFQCLDFPEKADLHLQESYSKTGSEWFNYPLGVIDHFVEEGYALSGLDMLFSGNLPIGAGLSSSASIEVLTAFALAGLFDVPISKLDIAKLSKKVENDFIGMNCGIMDQFAVTFGEAHKAILLNCDTLEYELLPFDSKGYVLAIINTNKARKLTDSKYNERFAECGRALKMLKTGINANNLCDIGVEDFLAHKDLIGDAVLEKRALHVVSENERVQAAARVLTGGDLAIFGKLMYASHQSLRELYEVSGPELDAIVDYASSHPGCLGARMTGAGFGGCAIALVKQESVDDFRDGLTTFYTNKIGYAPNLFASEIGNGVREISL